MNLRTYNKYNNKRWFEKRQKQKTTTEMENTNIKTKPKLNLMEELKNLEISPLLTETPAGINSHQTQTQETNTKPGVEIVNDQSMEEKPFSNLTGIHLSDIKVSEKPNDKPKFVDVQIVCQHCWTSSRGAVDFTCECKRVSFCDITIVSITKGGILTSGKCTVSYSYSTHKETQFTNEIDLGGAKLFSYLYDGTNKVFFFIIHGKTTDYRSSLLKYVKNNPSTQTPRRECRTCHGSGTISGNSFHACNNCEGYGGIPCKHCVVHKHFQFCPMCTKTPGFFLRCGKCDGAGVLIKSKNASWPCTDCYSVDILNK